MGVISGSWNTQRAKDRDTERKSDEESSESGNRKQAAQGSEGKHSQRLKHQHDVMSGIWRDPAPMAYQSTGKHTTLQTAVCVFLYWLHTEDQKCSFYYQSEDTFGK